MQAKKLCLIPKLSCSRLAEKIIEDDTKIQVDIYRGEEESGCILEVINEENSYTLWDESFDADQETLVAVMKVIEQDGIRSFLDVESEAMHLASHHITKVKYRWSDRWGKTRGLHSLRASHLGIPGLYHPTYQGEKHESNHLEYARDRWHLSICQKIGVHFCM
jgi:hypothetical protein